MARLSVCKSAQTSSKLHLMKTMMAPELTEPSVLPLSVEGGDCNPKREGTVDLSKLESFAAYWKGAMTLQDLVLPEDKQFNLPHDKFDEDGDQFPSIDMSKIRNEVEKSETIAQLVKASTTWGFFKIVNHGVPLELVERIEAHAHSIFTLPLDNKLNVEQPTGTFFGYSGGNGRFLSNPTWMEAMQFQSSHEKINEMAKKIWPEDDHLRAKLSADMIEYADVMELLAIQLLELLCEGLGLNPKYLTHLYKRERLSLSSVRLNYYPPCPLEPNMMQGLMPHTDPQTLTILHQSNVGGLQLLKDGKWIGVRPDARSFIVNIGDSLQAWSNGRYRSVEHRVALNSTTARVSFPFFLNPIRSDTVIAPAPELLDEAHHAKYKPFTWSEYLKFIATNRLPHRLDNVLLSTSSV